MKNKLSVVFLSNYFNHHQQPFSNAMYGRCNYLFIETATMTQERRSMGWGMDQLPEYVVGCEDFYADQEKWQERIDTADVVIFGSAPHGLLRKRIKENLLTFRYAERPLKNGLELWRYPDRFVRWHRQNPMNRNVFLLCASGYAAQDYAKFMLFRGKCFKWGYFPETRRYEDLDSLIRNKTQASLIWVARYIDWKHPELAVALAKRLKKDGYTFSLEMIGNGALLESVRQTIREEGLEEEVRVLGVMTPDQVRDHMEKAQIHLFTSDQQEGWGAVLNEAMNSGCVSVSDRRIGAAPYLIENGKNGFLYSGVEDLYQKVTYLLDHQEEREAMAKAAYETIQQEWNAEMAAERFLQLAGQLKNSPDTLSLPSEGVCSRAEEI